MYQIYHDIETDTQKKQQKPHLEFLISSGPQQTSLNAIWEAKLRQTPGNTSRIPVSNENNSRILEFNQEFRLFLKAQVRQNIREKGTVSKTSLCFGEIDYPR